jgi:putative membrane protein
MMFGGGMLLFWLLPIALIVLVAMWLFNNGSSSRDSTNRFNQEPTKEPEDLLKERYARGEISREEYEEMRRTLAQ